MKDLNKIAEKMLVRNPRILEFGLEIFKDAVKAQEGIELTDDEAKEVGRLILKIELPEGAIDLRHLSYKEKSHTKFQKVSE